MLMKCEEIENKILDYQDNRLSLVQQAEMEDHLAGCAGCRTFARQIRQLDAALLAGVKVPVLSAGFERRLRDRIQTVPQAASEAQRAERKRQLQAEFDAGLTRIARQSFAWASVLKHLRWPLLAIAAACLTWCFASQLTVQHLNPQSLDGLPSNLIPVLAACAVFLAICVLTRTGANARRI